MPSYLSGASVKLVAVASALAALVVALGISSAAADHTATVGTHDIKNESVRSQDVRDNSIKGDDVRDGSLTQEDFAEGEVPGQGPPGPQGEPGPAVESFTFTLGEGRGTFECTDEGEDLAYECEQVEDAE